MTEDERSIAEQSNLPIDKGTIIDYLSRFLAVNKDMRIEESKRAFRFADDADVLFGLPEYAVVLGIVAVIEQDESNWYPPISKLKKFCDDEHVPWPNVEDREGYEDVK